MSTADCGPSGHYSFHLHRSLNARPLRYVPGYSVNAIGAVARKVGATHLICDSPYLAPAVHRVSWEWGAPWYLRTHSIERERFRQLGKLWWPLMGFFEGSMMRKAKGTFFLSPEDCRWALKQYALKASAAHVSPFGVGWEAAPHDKTRARQWIAAEHGIDPNAPWLYFLGALGYEPNADAVRNLVHHVVPGLQKAGQDFSMLIGGKGLNEDVVAELEAAGGKIHYLGFVENIDYLIKACDVMLNPVLSRGGVRTKAIEALAYDKIVVSTQAGAAGIERSVCGPNLLVAANGNWEAFAGLTLQAMDTPPAIPQAFFEHYYWGNIAANMLAVMGIDL